MPEASLLDHLKLYLFSNPPSPEAAPSHGVFGSQTTELLKMITQKGPLSPDQLGMAQAQAYNLQAQNLEVRAALANPDVVRAFSNPEVRSVLDYGVSN